MNRSSDLAEVTASARLEIIIEEREVSAEFIRHSCILRRIDGTDSSDVCLWFEVPAHLPQIDPTDAEPFLIACLMDAMQENRSLHVHGKVSFQLLSNLQEFMTAWASWKPTTYSVVKLTANSITPFPEPSALAHDGAVVLHTGALNATSTIFRHHSALEGHRSRKIVAGVIVQGHLIPLSKNEKFARSFAIAKSALDDIEVSLYPLKTNISSVIRAHWSDAYGAVFVSGLQFFKPLARTGLIGAPKPYSDLDVFPNGVREDTAYGSNPFTNALLSSDSFQILHDGCRFDFMEKTDLVTQWPAGVRQMRVCWRGGQDGPHCGTCEECIRTKLAFMALGKEYPESLGAAPTVKQILQLASLSYDGRVEIRQLLDYCRTKRVKAYWIRPLRLRLLFDRFWGKIEHLKWLISRATNR